MPMRPLFWLALLALAAPFAAAQAAVAPSIALDPARLELPPGGQGSTIVVLSNPTASPIELTLSVSPADGVRASFGRTIVSIPAGSSERVELKIAAPDTGNEIRPLDVRAAETQRSADVNARVPVELRETLTLEIRARTPDAQPTIQRAPEGAFRLVPLLLDVAPGNTTQGTIRFRNVGNESVAPSFEALSGPALTFTFAATPAVPPGDEIEIPFGLTAADEAPPGSRRVEIQARGVAAPSQFLRVNVLAVGIVPPTPDPDPVPNAIDPPLVTAAAVAVGVAGTWSALWLSRRQWWPLLASVFAPLYTRLRPSAMLDHPVRARIVQVVKENPGITFGDLARRVEIGAGQLTHHARMLEKAGIVFSSPDGQTRRFFHVAEGRLAPVAPLAERLLGLVEQQPRRLAELARELGVSRQALHYHVKQLVAQGKLVARAEGRETWLELPREPSRAAPGLARS